MKKAVVTFRVPKFVDIDLEFDDNDYEAILDEWDKSNFGRVKAIIEKYVDLNDVEVSELNERYGEVEVVDFCLQEEQNLTDDFEQIDIEQIDEEDDDSIIELDVEFEEDLVECNTITPKGKPN